MALRGQLILWDMPASVHRMTGGKHVKVQHLRAQRLKPQAGGVVEGLAVMPGALGWISCTHNLAWCFSYFLPELARQKQIRRSRSFWTTGDPVPKPPIQASVPHLIIIESATYSACDLVSPSVKDDRHRSDLSGPGEV